MNKMGFEDVCNISLGLGLGCHQGKQLHENRLKVSQQQQQKTRFNLDHLFPTHTSMSIKTSLTLGLSEETYQQVRNNINVNQGHEEHHIDVQTQASSPHTHLSSSFSNASVKRERDMVSEDMEAERVSSRASDEDEEASGRKKLRLTKEQSALLEESFKEHSTLNPKQKQALAKQLNLRPRQVEVWFQNRRARTKLKQTEVDCEFLKKCCESLTDENRRLQKELQDLKALKLAPPLYMQLPAATLTMCPSCEKIASGGGGGGGGGGGESSSKNPFAGISTKSHFYNPFSHPSAAC